MQQTAIPGIELAVSRLCLGTMTFGNPVSESNAIRLVHRALDHGINFIDTADIYEGYDRRMGSPGGTAERILGKALQNRRSQAVLTTKVGNSVGGDGYEGKGLGREHIEHQIDASLSRLNTDYVDFYELHIADPDTPLAESIETMAGLIQAGKVRHWGFSNFAPEQISEMITLCEVHGWPRPVIAQPQYNWLNREAEPEYLPLCRVNGIAITPYQPLQGGLLTGKYRAGAPLPKDSRAAENPAWLAPEPETLAQVAEFEREAAAARANPAPYAVRWLLDQPGIASVVAGVKSTDQLAELAQACN